MQFRTGAFGVLVATGLMASLPAFSAESSATAPSTAPATMQKEAEDDFQKGVSENKIAGDQLARIEAKRKAFYEGRDALDASEVGIAAKAAREAINEAKKTKDEAKIAAAEAAGKPALDAYSKKRAELRASVFAEFTLEQQKKYAGRWLHDVSIRSVRKAQLTPEQVAQFRAAADRLAAAYVTEGMMATDPYLWKLLDTQKPLLVEEARKSILTKEQVQLLDEPPAAATKAATTKAAP